MERNPYIATKTLLSSLFTQQELISHCVCEKAPKSKIKAKPRFDGRKYSIFMDIIHEKFPTLDTKDITAKVQAFQNKPPKKHSTGKLEKLKKTMS